MNRVEAEMSEIMQQSACFTRAVEAIGDAAIAQNHGRELTGEGLDQIRQAMKEGKKAPTEFSSSRGQAQASNNRM